MSYILTLAGLLSAALLWIGAALERVGKVFMFLGVMINWVGSTLQGWVNASTSEAKRTATALTARNILQGCQTETCATAQSTQTYTTACVAQGTQTMASPCVAQCTRTTTTSFTTQASQTTTSPCVAQGTQTDDIPEVCCACQQHDKRLPKLQLAGQILNEALVTSLDVNAELRTNNILLMDLYDDVSGQLDLLEEEHQNLKNEKTAAAAKLEAVRNDLAHAQADKLYLEEQLARVRRESSSSGSSEGATEHSDSSSVVTEDGDEDMPLAFNSSGGVAPAGASNWQAKFQSLGLAQQVQSGKNSTFSRGAFDMLNVEGGFNFRLNVED